MPTYEVPARVESIRAARLTDGDFSFTDPAGHGLEPVLAVHHEGLVRFLGEAWGRWRAYGGEGGPLDLRATPGGTAAAGRRPGGGGGLPAPVLAAPRLATANSPTVDSPVNAGIPFDQSESHFRHLKAGEGGSH
jgi:hypothetical protein